MPKNIYLDHAASTPMTEKAIKTLLASVTYDFANPEAVHSLGKKIKEKMEEIRSSILSMLNAPPQSYFIFTSSATESNNTILRYFGQIHDIFMISSADHPSLSKPMLKFKKIYHEIPLNSDGTIHFDSCLELIKIHRPSLIALSHINNQTGTIHPWQKLCQEIKQIHPDIHFHLDAAQSWGKIPLSLHQDQMSQIDSVSFSAHKMGGPKGIGGLYLSPNLTAKLQKNQQFPLMMGGFQENGFRSSTPAAPLIFSWYEAITENIPPSILKERYVRVKNLHHYLIDSLKKEIPSLKFPFNKESKGYLDHLDHLDHSENLSPYILSFIIPQISSDIILRHLEEKSIFVSSTSACSSRIKGENPVFKALHLNKQFSKNVLRISFSDATSVEEIDTFIQCLKTIIHDLSTLIK